MSPDLMDHNGGEAAVVKLEACKESSLIINEELVLIKGESAITKEKLADDHEGAFDGYCSERDCLKGDPPTINHDDLDHKLGAFPGEVIPRTSGTSDLVLTADDEGTEGELAALDVEDQGQQRTANLAASAKNDTMSNCHRCDLCGLTFPSVNTLQRHLSTHSNTLCVSPQHTESSDSDYDFNEEYEDDESLSESNTLCVSPQHTESSDSYYDFNEEYEDDESLSESEIVGSDRVTRSSSNTKRRIHDKPPSSKSKKQKRSPASAKSAAVGEASASSAHHEQLPVEWTNTDAKSDDDGDNDGSGADAIRAHRCTICGKRYKYNRGLKLHLGTHSAFKTHKCDVCAKVYVRRDVMLRHRREVHLKDESKTGKQKPNFACDMCDKRFVALYQLKKHKRHHIDKRPFKCDICDRAFLLKGDLAKHYFSHSQERPYKCKVCKRGFARNTTLKKHLRTHTGEKPYSCDTCGTTFARQDILALHKRLHTGETPYKCATCGATFSQKSNLLWHVKGCK